MLFTDEATLPLGGGGSGPGGAGRSPGLGIELGGIMKETGFEADWIPGQNFLFVVAPTPTGQVRRSELSDPDLLFSSWRSTRLGLG